MGTEPTPPPAHQPYVPDDVTMPEFTWSAVLVGAVLGIIFGASSLYLVLKVGMTVSASIPVAVLSITLFRWLGQTFGIRRATILENNIVQTTGSAGESIAFGVGVTMPALMLIGFEMEWSRVLVVSVLGGLLGILMMIPLRRAFIVKLHGRPGEKGTLLYPEGTACAQVLISGEKGGTSGQTVFIGFGLAFAHKLFTEGMNLLLTTVEVPLKLGKSATDAFSRVARVTGDMASELLGVGYIIGVRTSAVMMAGAVLGGLVLTPTIALSSDAAAMDTADIYRNYLRFIGAGCVAAAGIISMGRTLPIIVRSFSSGLGSLRGGDSARRPRTRRTDDDMPPTVVLGGSLVLLVVLALFLMSDVNPVSAVLGAALVLMFGFLFVTVSSRLTGEIGSSSNPISGMTVATLLLTCLIFLGLGMTSPLEAVLALSIGGVVCIAASNGGTTSQDLKTGFLIGATPRWQQWAILFGALTSSVLIGGILLLFNSVGTIYSQRNLPAVNLKDRLGDLVETEVYEGETFHVWRPSTDEELPSVVKGKKKVVVVKPGKYLVDGAGQVCYQVDPTITGEVEVRDAFSPYDAPRPVTLTEEELERIPNTVTRRERGGKTPGNIVIDRLWKNDKENAQPADTQDKKKREPYSPDLKEGLYLVNEDGRVVGEDHGKKVLKFKAPKTQVMGIIINGLLRENLNWALVLIGAFIAVMLELCGISSLAFAVGVYIPMQYSTPIFLGGLVRWGVDTYTARQARQAAAIEAPDDPAARAAAEVRAIARSESSPGVLLASGLIAGGSLAGVMIAFTNFVPEIQEAMNFAKPVADFFGGKEDSPALGQMLVALAVFAVLAVVLLLAGIGKIFKAPPEEDGDGRHSTGPPGLPSEGIQDIARKRI
jgi:putative OPT family oligopeptide transporter